MAGAEAERLSTSECARLGGLARLKLTDELHGKIVMHMQLGNYAEVALAACGVREGTYYRWLRVGKRVEDEIGAAVGDDHDYDESSSYEELQAVLPELTENDWRQWKLKTAIAKASAEAESYAVGMVRTHFGDQWTAAMTFLERRAPKRWKRRDLHEVALADRSRLDEENGLLEESASALVHDALREAARLALPAGEAPIEGTATEIENRSAT